MEITVPPENQDKSTYSNTLKWVAAILAELIILIGVFALGMNVGFRKAHFTDEWIKNYPANFGSQAGAYPLPLPPPVYRVLVKEVPLGCKASMIP